nr:hypothetical protein [Tanacetum cinerariifolium]
IRGKGHVGLGQGNMGWSGEGFETVPMSASVRECRGNMGWSGEGFETVPMSASVRECRVREKEFWWENGLATIGVVRGLGFWQKGPL